MHLLDSTLILSPSDLAESLLCDHLVALELAAARGTLVNPAERSAEVDVMARRGADHEQSYLDSSRSAGKSVATIRTRGHDLATLREAEAATFAAMQSGVDVIHQASFFDGRWTGRVDFLERVETPSQLGSFSYEAVDTKLARRAKVEALLQTMHYSEHVGRLQGRQPEHMHLVLGNGNRMTFLVKDFGAYYRSIKRRFEATLDGELDTSETYPDPVEHCAVCDWSEQCTDRRTTDDHLSLVAGMGRHQVQKLKNHGITTVVSLGTSGAVESVRGIGKRTLDKLHNQARLQVQQRDTGEVHYELLEPEGVGRGFGGLPAPSSGDLFFDMEGDPYVGTGGLEYLFGVTELTDGSPTYRAWWGHDDAGERNAFEQFIDFVMQRLMVDPQLHIYHYAPYEVTAVKKLAGRYGTREVEVDSLLRGDVFVDLYRVVRQSIRVSQDSYSIKKLEPLYMGKRETEVTGGGDSIVAYETWLEVRDQRILDDIEAYNKDDCDSTLRLRNWLEERRSEASIQFGEIARPEPAERTAPETVSELDTRINALDEALCSGIPDQGATPEQQARRLLSRLLEWHRRENKSEWWRYFDLCDMTDDELLEDREALAGLTYEGVVDDIKRSYVHRYRFDPNQDHKITMSTPHDPKTGKSAGTVVAVDGDQGVIDLKRAKTSTAEHPSALVPPGPIPQPQQQEALIDVGQWVVSNDIDVTGSFSAVRDLILRRAPRLKSGTDLVSSVAGASTSADAACRVVLDLDDSCLAIQGPPGSGKTYTGAEIVLALVRAGKRVGITATSHKVVSNMLEAVAKHAKDARVDVRILQKADESDRCAAPEVVCTQDNKAVDTALQDGSVDVVGGTAWLFSRESLREAFDVLIVDEAGQMSLADVVAVGTTARSVVLLGDPQQLAQPSKGVHPDGAEQSALGHLIGSHQTIPADLGLLLDRTWRMHPDVCMFVSEAFYDARLGTEPSCSRQVVEGGDELAGVGVRYMPVVHGGSHTSSSEEAAVIKAAIDRLLGRAWTNRKGESRSITLEDILVVAPYNAQVALLRGVLPDGARVGTVDKFQGQQAAVVFYSMAASSPDDISRGMEFLYSHNRLNVAISRAHCLSFLVCSPSLLTIACKTPDQARLANALCALVESSDGLLAS